MDVPPSTGSAGFFSRMTARVKGVLPLVKARPRALFEPSQTLANLDRQATDEGWIEEASDPLPAGRLDLRVETPPVENGNAMTSTDEGSRHTSQVLTDAQRRQRATRREALQGSQPEKSPIAPLRPFAEAEGATGQSILRPARQSAAETAVRPVPPGENLAEPAVGAPSRRETRALPSGDRGMNPVRAPMAILRNDASLRPALAAARLTAARASPIVPVPREETTVKISIGRIDIKAAPSPPVSPPRAERPPPDGLEHFLRRRDRSR
jgi:hypothetical protein